MSISSNGRCASDSNLIATLRSEAGRAIETAENFHILE